MTFDFDNLVSKAFTHEYGASVGYTFVRTMPGDEPLNDYPNRDLRIIEKQGRALVIHGTFSDPYHTDLEKYVDRIRYYLDTGNDVQPLKQKYA